MRCAICDQPTRVLDTRGELRRRECPAGHRFATKEVLAGALAHIGSAAVARAAAAASRGHQRRALANDRKTTARKLLAEGWKPTAIAHELGISDARVCQIRKETRARA